MCAGNKGASEAGNNTQQTPSVSSTTQIADSSAEMIEDGNSGLTTLAETAAEYGYKGCGLEYPNFESISVGMLYKDENQRFCLFDSHGYVHHILMKAFILAPAFIMECALRVLEQWWAKMERMQHQHGFRKMRESFGMQKMKRGSFCGQ